MNPVLGRMTALSVSEHMAFGDARNPHAPKCIPVSSAPRALSCIPIIEFLNASRQFFSIR